MRDAHLPLARASLGVHRRRELQPPHPCRAHRYRQQETDTAGESHGRGLAVGQVSPPHLTGVRKPGDAEIAEGKGRAEVILLVQARDAAPAGHGGVVVESANAAIRNAERQRVRQQHA